MILIINYVHSFLSVSLLPQGEVRRGAVAPDVPSTLLLESIWWGISIWTVTYFYVWPLLVIVTAMIPKSESAFMYIVLAAAYGLLFGMLCSLTTLVLSGWKAAVAWWVAGIPYDLIHCVSNGIVAAVLFRPLVHALEKLN